MASHKSPTAQYLQRYAETDVAQLHDWPPAIRFDYALVLPAFDEQPGFLRRLLASTLPHHNALAIIVVNRPDTSPTCPANERLIAEIQSHLPLRWRSSCASLSLWGELPGGVLLVDRQRTPIPHRQGVGLARKLGADLAVELIARGQVRSPWIHSTDADAQLPTEYLTQTEGLDATCAAACYGFTHSDDGTEIARATQLYEQHLRHYTEGLRRAGSPYGFYTIGSILAFHYAAYCKARGFPKRAGGEDFYLLNKLAKLGPIATLEAVIELQPRLSQRVPFGTGPATSRILADLQRGEPFTSYHPGIFTELQHWLSQVERYLAQSANCTLEPGVIESFNLHPSSLCCLRELGIEACWQHLNQSPDRDWRQRHFHTWFDGFRTLKFVHFLQRNGFPPQPPGDKTAAAHSSHIR